MEVGILRILGTREQDPYVSVVFGGPPDLGFGGCAWGVPGVFLGKWEELFAFQAGVGRWGLGVWRS